MAMRAVSNDAKVMNLAHRLAGDKWQRVLDLAKLNSADPITDDPGTVPSFNRALADALETFNCRTYPMSKRELATQE